MTDPPPPQRDAAQGPQVAAFFDLDLTLLSVNSASLWLKYLWRAGEVSLPDMLRSVGWLVRYKFAMIDISQVTGKALRSLEGLEEEALQARINEWYDREVAHRFYEDAIAKVESHRAQGHRLYIATGSSPYVAQRAARQLNMDDFVCTRVEVEDGRFTGRPVMPICYGDGKLTLASALATRDGVDMSQSWFYTDSYTDLPLLRAVGHPVATNPDPRLRRLASLEGIRILDFKR